MSSSDTDETPTISFLISNKKKRLLVIDGYIYQQNKSTAKVSYWLCEIKLCNAGVHLNSDDQFRQAGSASARSLLCEAFDGFTESSKTTGMYDFLIKESQLPLRGATTGGSLHLLLAHYTIHKISDGCDNRFLYH
ncbi:unnamed protein product [Rotaria magnacalcarata]